MERKQVIIVGGGPVGVALAVQLGMRGITCVLVESRTEVGRIPKGQNLTHRTLENFYFMGIVDELRAARFLPPGFAIGEITSYGDLNGKYWFAPAGRELVHDYYFQTNDRLPQYQMEKVLRTKMATLPKAESPVRLDRHQGRAGRRLARASPSQRMARPRCWRRTTSSAATAAIPSCASRSAFRAAAPTSISSWC